MIPHLAAIVLLMALLAPAAGAVAQPSQAPAEPGAVADALQEGPGRIACRITENGKAASGTSIVRQNGREVARGTCGEALPVTPGRYEVTLQLDGALDRPEQTRRIAVQPGSSAEVSADFATGKLEIATAAGGRRAAAMAVVMRQGRQVATLGSGVTGHLSAGTYDVVVRYRSEERRFAGVTIAPGQHRILSAEF